MAFRFDPRGDLPPSTIQSIYYKPLLPYGRRMQTSDGINSYMTLGRLPGPHTTTRTRQPGNILSAPVACHDWIFSSASNVHVAVDRSAFKTYTSFKSYVLRVADQSPVKVRGIGTVELKIRRQPGSKESHTITLENVLHVPKWICNVFSDIYFEPINAFEHTWTDFGVSFLKEEAGQLKCWGFTEGFLGLERLVLSNKIRGRSPMLEDQDREVFSVNLTWPQGQRDRWEDQLAVDEKEKEERQQMKLKRDSKGALTEMTAMASPTKTLPNTSVHLEREHRRGLTDLSANVMHRRGPSDRASSLKSPTTRSRGSSFTERFSSLA